MDYKQIKESLAEELQAVKMTIEDALSTNIDVLNQTNSAILNHSGKLVRPVMALLLAKACNSAKINDDTIRFAAAAELVHNATLLHDDVADNSDSRRGEPTTMSILGSRASVLLGDFWLVKAIDRILRAERHAAKVLSIFSNTLSDLAEGEMLQIQKAIACNTNEADYIRIIYNKTASLFVATAYSAAISVAASEQLQEAVSKYATHLGIAFQIKDDILDYNGGEKLGKPIGQDIREQKITMPLLGAFQNVDPAREEDIRQKLMKVHDNEDFVKEILIFVDENKGIQYAQQYLETEIQSAKDSLAPLEDSEFKSMLFDLADFMVGRSN